MSAVPTLHLSTHRLGVGYTARADQAEKALLAELNLTLSPGRLIALLGRNGTGKSTLLRTLAGLHPPLGGKILLGKRDFLHLPPPDRARFVSIVQPHPGHTGLIRARELVNLGRFPHVPWHGKLSPHDHAVVEAAMNRTGSLPLADRIVETLSDGERQRVVLARAVAQATPLILLDEPTAFLDINGKVEMLRTLRTMAEAGSTTLVISTHDLELALKLAHELWIVEAGGILCTRPETPESARALHRVFPGIQGIG